MLFDGESVWFGLHNTLTCLDAKGHALSLPSINYNFHGMIAGITFDGTHIWIVSEMGGMMGQLSSLRISDGLMGSPLNLNFTPIGVLFDGFNLWVANKDNNEVVKYQRDFTEIGRFPIACLPLRMMFDGQNLWVTDGNTVCKLLVYDGSPLGTFRLNTSGFGPCALVFDGINTWVGTADGLLFKL
jgi:hypothetical protein